MTTPCHECIAELINRHTALAGMIKHGHLGRAAMEVIELGKVIDDMALRCIKSGKLKYNGEDNESR